MLINTKNNSHFQIKKGLLDMAEERKKKANASQNEKTAPKSSSKNQNKTSSSKKPSSSSSKNKSGGSRERIKEPVPAAPRSSNFVHQFLPYVLYVAVFFMAACYIYVNLVDSGDSVGVVGRLLNNLFCGLFGWPAFLIPLVLLNLAVFWRKSPTIVRLIPIKPPSTMRRSEWCAPYRTSSRGTSPALRKC